MTSSAFPARLRTSIDARGLSIRGLAKSSGKSTGAVWAWLAGKYLPAADTIEVLAAALGVTPAWLAFGHECDEPKEKTTMLTSDTKSQVRALATASYYWYLASLPRPLSPFSPAEDARGEEQWTEATSDLDSVSAAARQKIPDVRTVLAALADSGHAGERARGIARDQLNRLGCDRPFTLHGYGEGWNDMPRITV